MESLQNAMTQTVGQAQAKTALVPTVSYAALAKAVHILQDGGGDAPVTVWLSADPCLLSL